MRSRFLALAFLATACSPATRFDADGGELDSGLDVDAGAVDSGTTDGGTTDSGVTDSGTTDGGIADGGIADSGTTDGGVTDGGITDGGPTDAGLVCLACPAYQSAPLDLGAIAVSALTEISGIAVSRAHTGVVYAHNDSGGLPVIYAFSTAGAPLGEFTLVGAVNHDWEDISLGPCPSGTCVYVAEIGDNGSNATYPYAVYRIAEPNIAVGAPGGAQSVAAEKFELEYPNGEKHNAETLMVHPVTGDVYVVIKTALGQKSAVYKATAPLSATAPNPLVKLTDLAVPAGLDLPITGGDISPCGTAVLLRAYNTIYEFRLPGGAAFDSIFTAPFSRVTAAVEQQGEAIAWTDDGRGYFTTSEGVSQHLHFVYCQ